MLQADPVSLVREGLLAHEQIQRTEAAAGRFLDLDSGWIGLRRRHRRAVRSVPMGAHSFRLTHQGLSAPCQQTYLF